MVDVRIEERSPQPAAALHGEERISELPAFFERAFPAVMAAVTQAGATVAGPPFGYYPTMPGDVVAVEAGFPTATPIGPVGDVRAIELPGGRVAVTVHVGPYEALSATYEQLMAWLAEHGHRLVGGMCEYYLSDPAQEPDPATWRTEIVCPIAG
jgi:effector-binding domain-containing protein